jgi:hypothetical protein
MKHLVNLPILIFIVYSILCAIFPSYIYLGVLITSGLLVYKCEKFKYEKIEDLENSRWKKLDEIENNLRIKISAIEARLAGQQMSGLRRK